jgi:hypothetical protein
MNVLELSAVLIMATLFLILIASVEKILAVPMLIASTIGGWKKIAEKYPDRQSEQDETFRFCSLLLNRVPYNSCITIRIGEEYLTLAPIFPFRCFHPPISIPLRILQPRFETLRSFKPNEFEIDQSGHIIGVNRSIATRVCAALKIE